MRQRHDLYHIRAVIYALLYNGLECLKRIRTLEIVIRPDEHSAVFVSRLTHPLGHLLLSLYLHIHIPGSSLDGPDQPPFSDLHRLYLAALGCHFLALERGLILRCLADAAGSHKRDIRRKQFICLPGCEDATVQTDLRHLTLFQSLIYLLQISVLYSCTNHILISIMRRPPQRSDLLFPHLQWPSEAQNAPFCPQPSCPFS